ncbi:transporter substrate-binding domain-containing protein [Poseidonibacter lekithochrous]|uniref:diguanylate cyclase n=1 Tax=Poseidonibacter TaxID=2321187 RepID=UPI001C08404A|nr:MULTISPECIES: transporter substrate-binding domain-containing protein [Poseidonibacter]MBU3015885.1 transporter substrate-binding domain-containing protein [Poseidonibacter lekithochrous]MDO6829184.1 transporter substrate-binding domain-containing protein [Poseidonibacter sp. 1_MG-2023]
MYYFNKTYLIKIIIILVFFNCFASAEINLTHKEKQFIQNHPILTVGIGKGWIPYIIENTDGTISGHNVDIINEIKKQSGLEIKFFIDTWTNVLEEVKKDNIDGLAMSIAHKERAEEFDFTNVYGSMQKLIFTRKKEKNKEIFTLKDLEGKSIAILRNNLLELKIAKKLKNVKIVFFDTYVESIKAVSLGEVDALISEAAILYVANKIGMPYLEPLIFLEDKLDMVFSIRKDFPEATSIINKSLDAIGKSKLLDIQHKWFLDNPNKIKSEQSLSSEELEYLKNKKSINACIDPNWMPFEAFDKNGKHIGLSSDYFNKFRKELSIPINIIRTKTWNETLEFTKSRKCDIISLAMKTDERSKYLNFSLPYLITPLVLATKPDKSFINNFNNLSNEKLGIPKGYAFTEILKKSYPNLNIIEVTDINEGLEKVIDGQLFGYIGTLNSIGYLFQREFAGELKIAAKFDESWELGTAVRNDDQILLNIFNKLITNIEEKDKQNIFNKWITLKYEEKVDYSLIIKIILISILVIGSFIYWNRKLENARNKLELANKENEKYLKMINSHVLISSTDINGVIIEVSDALCNLTGYKRSEIIGKNHNIFRHQDMKDIVFSEMWKTIKSKKVWKGEIKSLKKDGTFYWADVIVSPSYDNNKNVIGYSAIRNDITDKKRIEHLSITDKLTGIANRSRIDDISNYEIKRAIRHGSSLGIILLDIDNFKKVNDNYGHLIGDKVLISIANILKNNIREIDLIGRWGGEEFLIICPYTNKDGIINLCEVLRKKIEEYSFEDCPNQSVSFGATTFVKGDTIDTIISRADKALYKAKNAGRNRAEFI